MLRFPFKRHLILLVSCILLLGVLVPITAFAKALPSTPTPTSTNNRGAIAVVPFEFDPGKTETVEASWVPGEGLVDQRGTKNEALLLTKLSKTTTNAASGATVTNVKGLNLMELGFDVRADGHCGAGAPRFNVVTSDGTTHFAGCAAATTTPAGTDPQGNTWLRKRFDVSSASTNVFPPFTPGTTVKSISIIFDEGVDTGPDFKGWTYLDNIDINGTLVGQGPTE
jgi:hypothetical protein